MNWEQELISPPFRFPIGRVIIRNIIFINTIEHQRRQSSKNPCKSTIPTAIRIDLWKTLTRTKRGDMKSEIEGFTRQVVEEGDLNGAADDGVNPEPPAGAEHRAGDAWSQDLPHQQEVVHDSLRSIRESLLLLAA